MVITNGNYYKTEILSKGWFSEIQKAPLLKKVGS